MLRRVGYVLLGLALAGQVLVLALWPGAHVELIDLQVYRAGGEAVLRGDPLYAGGILLDLPFVYPPFAAVLFAPLALLPLWLLKILWTVVGILLLGFVARRYGAAPVLFVLVAICLDPVRTTLYLGQINIVLLALVAGDLLGKKRGYGVGLAAAIKLTPLLFVGYLLVTGRIRAALTALATFAAATAVGFLCAPAESARYWFGGIFVAADRISAVAGPSNTSLRGTFARLGIESWWLPAAVALGVATLLVARLLHRAGAELPAVTLVGLATAALAPFAWSHHWVWVAPLLVSANCRYSDNWHSRALALVVAAAVVTKLPGPGVGPIPATGLVSLLPDAYVVLFLAVLVLAVRSASRSSRRPARSHSP